MTEFDRGEPNPDDLRERQIKALLKLADEKVAEELRRELEQLSDSDLGKVYLGSTTQLDRGERIDG